MFDAVIIGVAGGSGSGKTTVVQELVRRLSAYPVTVIQHDWYYRDWSHLPPQERAAINFDHPDAIQTEMLVEHLKQLRSGLPVEAPVYDFVRHERRSETLPVPPGKAIIVEGILVLAEPALRELMDLKLFVDTDADIRFIRRLQRDMTERGRTMESVIRQYLQTVQPMHSQFVEPSKRQADVIIPEGGQNLVAVDLIAARVSEIIRSSE
ncbi:MAG: uridine kinase [Anaerolineae bacterium]|nr:uridine kinase [Anaerolineae bacterium]